MAPATFHLISLKAPNLKRSFVEAVRAQPVSERPLYLGESQHWIHSPHLSSGALTGTGDEMQRWDYLVVTRASTLDSLALSDALTTVVDRRWSITAGVDDQQLDNMVEATRTRSAAEVLSLPAGWSPNDPSGLLAASPPDDLEASLALSSYRLGSYRTLTTKPTVLKDWIADFGSEHTGPVQMFNLLSYVPGQQPRYLQYIAAFTASVGSKYGGEPVFSGLGGITDWTSKADERQSEEDVMWEHLALVYYPSLWHFAKMLDDPAYMDADKRFKQGALRDNPILCCTEVDLD